MKSKINIESFLTLTGFTLFLVVLLGSFLRIYGLDWGASFLYHEDEIDIVQRAFVILASQDLNPHWFGHPGTTLMYLLAILYIIYGTLGILAGSISQYVELGQEFWSNPWYFYFIGRATIATISIITTLQVYSLARRLTSPCGALIASAFLALSPLYIEFSQIVRSDIIQIFFLLVSTWFLIKVIKQNTTFSYCATGFFLGLAIASKYPSVVFSISIISAFIFAHNTSLNSMFKGWRKLALSGIFSLVGAFIGSPFLFLDFSTVLKDVFREARHYHLGATSDGFLQSFQWYLSTPLSDSLTILGLTLALTGIVIAWYKNNNIGKILSIFPIMYLVFISSLSLKWGRWILPIIPFLAIFIGYTCDQLITTGSHMMGGKWIRSIIFVILAPTLFSQTSTAFNSSNSRATDSDTRKITQNWLIKNIPDGSKILMERYTTPLPREKFQIYYENEGKLTNTLDSLNMTRPTGIIGNLDNIDFIFDKQIAYMIIGSDYQKRMQDIGRQQKEIEIYNSLMKKSTLLFSIKADPTRKISGPPQQLYRFN